MPLVTGILTAADVELLWVENNGGGVTPEPDPALQPLVAEYTHFDLTTEKLGRTSRYNCWGFTFLPRRYWINSDADVDQILADNCSPVTGPLLPIRPGDVIRYRDSTNTTTHTGRVWEVDAAGNCTLVRSKWGGWGEYIHSPTHPYIYTDAVYGTNLAYFRQHAPLKGVIGDLWVMDAGDDDGEQYSDSLWGSPDILVDAPPYGSVDTNPAFGQVNHVWAVVHNRSQADINNARVRYYWADPHAGFAPSNWQLIPGTAGHPNPTNTFTVPGYSHVDAPYVEWVPVPVAGVPDPAHQCLLAISYINDDPKDSSNPDPIVYPFDLSWDNNIACRNVHVVTLMGGEKCVLHLETGLPFEKVDKVSANMRFRLAYVPRLPVFGVPTKIVAPEVRVGLGDKRVTRLADVTELKAGLAPHRMNEKTLALKEFTHVPLMAKKREPVSLEITAPKNAQPGSNFYLYVEQEVAGKVTGGYTVVITIA